jgi:peptidoglycan/LPS O-acetylase OafA/YrhL
MEETRKPRWWPILLLWVFLFLGFVALTVFVATEGILDVELALLTMLAVVGAITGGIERRTRRTLWRILTALMVLGALICLAVFFAVRLGAHPALVLAGLLPAIGLLLYLTFNRGDADARPLQATRVIWRRLGEPARREEPSPAERDRVPARK